jgi:hypothetical protein
VTENHNVHFTEQVCVVKLQILILKVSGSVFVRVSLVTSFVPFIFSRRSRKRRA